MPALYDTGLVLAMLCGFGAASLVVAVVGLASTSDFGTHSVYRALFPLIGIVLFIPALFGDQWMPFMVGTLTFGARIMMLLTLILCAAYAARTQFSPMLVYLACAYPLHVAGFLGDSVGFLLVAQDLSDYAVALRIPIVCLVICFAALAIVSFGKRPRSLAEPVDDTLLINPPRSMGADRGAPVRRSRVGRPAVSDRSCDGMGAVDGGVGGAVRGRADAVGEASVPEAPADGPRLPAGLSAREQEVVELLLKGNTIAAISRKLYISENTTRGHMKRIYRKFDVHSRQELVDLLEGRG